jgi:low affinity Fe/Cu permease
VIRHSSFFDRFARGVARYAGHPLAFAAAAVAILVWMLSGPLFGYSDTWQLVINTATTIVTFLMVFVIQNTQNRDGEAMQIKLDELVRAVEAADNALLDLEELSESDLEDFRKRYLDMAREARGRTRERSTGGER